MKAKVKGNWSLGSARFFDGQEVDLADDLVADLRARGYVECYETKVVVERPTLSRPARRRKTTNSKKSEGEEE